MHKERKAIIWAIAFIILSFFVVLLFFKPKDSDNDASGFLIDSFEVIMDVQDDGKVFVTENINVHLEPLKHGIFRFVPQWLTYTDKNGKVVKRKSLVKDIDVVDEIFKVSTVKKKKKIRIGDPNSYADYGENLYTIKYTYDMGSDPFKGFDEFIFHAFGDYWGTPINNPSLIIKMPKAFDASKIKFFTDKYRQEDITSAMDYRVESNTIYASLNVDNYVALKKKAEAARRCEEEKKLYNVDTCDDPYIILSSDEELLNSALTVDIELPEGYFVKGSYNYGGISFILSIGIIVITLITILKWYKHGKDLAKRAETVEFYPPEDLDAAQIGYAFNHNISSKKLVAALIVGIASKGYIKIDDVVKDGDSLTKRDIQFTNLVYKPDEKFASKIPHPERQIEVKKLKNIDDTLDREEREMMLFAFKSGNKKKLKANINRFLLVRDSLVEKGYIKVLSDNVDEVIDTPEKERIAIDSATKQYEKDLAKYKKAVAKLKPLTDAEQIVYDKLFSGSNTTSRLSTLRTFYTVFDKIDKELEEHFKENVYDKDSSTATIKSAHTILPLIIMNILSYFVFEDLDPKLSILYTISYACIFISLIFILLMRKKTEFGEALVAKIKGFKKFLELAKKEELEALVSKNPQYFFDILPYTYVLGVSKKWIKKFEDIPMPEVNIGTFSYDSDSFYSSMNSNIYHHSSGGSSSHGCSSCGGGCSSCGGGCSSCGGGGSW